ncbi:MAG: MalM family protein [Motiliproteus sp.]
MFSIKKNVRSGLVGLLLLTLCGGASGQSQRDSDAVVTPRAIALAALAKSHPCCARLAKLPFQPLSAETDLKLSISADSPSYGFDSGKSFFAAYQLPAGNRSFEIALQSLAGKTLLSPHVMLLDSQFQVTRLLGSTDFEYRPARGFKGDSIDGEIRVDRSQPNNPGNESYLIIYTSEQRLQQQTTLVHPAKAYAIGHGNQPPDIADPVVAHTPVGNLKLKLTVDSIAQGAQTYIPTRSKQDLMVNPEAQPAVTAGVKALPETEAFYLKSLDNALEAGDMDRALKLVEEAKRLGIDSVRARFLTRISAQ